MHEHGDIRGLNKTYWDENGNDFLMPVTLPQYSSGTLTERELNLFGDVSGKRLMLCSGMISTYINALAKAGFVVESLIERAGGRRNRSGFSKAMVIKARKL